MNPDRRALLSVLGSVTVAGLATPSDANATAHTRERAGRIPQRTVSQAKVIDVHTHMYGHSWLAALKASADKDVKVQSGPRGDALIYRSAEVGTIGPQMFDWDARLQRMDASGIDIALISLAAPNVYWGSKSISAKAAHDINDEFAAAQRKYAGRIRWMASLPWNDAGDAVEELHRAKAKGAIGVCMLTDILGVSVTEERYRAVWREIEALRMPTFIHPVAPFNDGLGLDTPVLADAIGLTSQTSLCFARMMVDGFLDAYPKLQLIACHGGGALPYLVARLDRCWERLMPDKPSKETPSVYMKRLHFDSIVYDAPTLQHLVASVGEDRVLFGSDDPFPLGDVSGILARIDSLPAQQQDKLRGGNARRLFDL